MTLGTVRFIVISVAMNIALSTNPMALAIEDPPTGGMTVPQYEPQDVPPREHDPDHQVIVHEMREDEPSKEELTAKQVAPSAEAAASSPTCAGHVKIQNLTSNSLKIIYSWPDSNPVIYTIKSRESMDVAPVYCSAELTVITNKKLFSVKIEFGKDYDLTWSPEKEMFIFSPRTN